MCVIARKNRKKPTTAQCTKFVVFFVKNNEMHKVC